MVCVDIRTNFVCLKTENDNIKTGEGEGRPFFFPHTTTALICIPPPLAFDVMSVIGTAGGNLDPGGGKLTILYRQKPARYTDRNLLDIQTETY